MTTPDEDLPGPVRDALRALHRDASPPPGSENRTVEALTSRGLLVRRPSARSGWLMQAVAAMLLIGIGWAAGRRGAAVPPPATGERYVLLLYGNVPDSGGSWTRAELVEEYSAWARAPHPTGAVLGGEELADTAIAIGSPAAETGPAPAGFFIVQAPDLASAIRLAETCPHLRHGGSVVLRPIPAPPA